jgi:hypothetical protein
VVLSGGRGGCSRRWLGYISLDFKAVERLNGQNPVELKLLGLGWLFWQSIVRTVCIKNAAIISPIGAQDPGPFSPKSRQKASPEFPPPSWDQPWPQSSPGGG